MARIAEAAWFAVLLGTTAGVSAETITLACEFVGGTNSDRPADADQVIIEDGAPSIDIRIARTMGTSAPVNWHFRNDPRSRDTFILTRRGDWIAAAAIRLTTPNAFALNLENGQFIWTYAAEGENARSYFFRCRR